MHNTSGTFFFSLSLMTFLAAALLLMSCRQQPTASESLSQAERVACEYPDSTKAYADLLRTAVRKAELEGDAATASRACLLLARQIQWTDEVTALQTARQALQYLDIAEGSVAERLQIQLTIAGLLEQTDSLAQAQSLYYYCLDKAREMQSADEERSALAGLANLLLAEGREAEALDMARQMTFSSGDSDNEARFVLARCYLQCDSLEQARAIYRQIDTHSNTKARYVALRHLTEIALLEGDIETAPVYVDSAFAAAEDVFFEAMQQKDEYHRANLDQERQAERMVYRQRLAQWLLAAVVIIALLVIAFLVSIHRHRQAIQQQHLLAEKREREQAEERLGQQEKMVGVLQNFIIEKSEILQRLHSESDKKIVLSESDWREMEETLDSITGGFVSRLRQQHPDFREEDIQLCMMTRMHLTNQAIAQIYLITVSAVKHRKLKLKKDGFGILNPEQPLDEVIATI